VKELLVVLSFFAVPTIAAEWTEVELREVRPTQAVVGFSWVNRKIEKFQDLSGKELDQRLRDEAPPAVLGPGGVIYILDKHHEFSALLTMGIEKAYVEIWKDFSKLTPKEFEREMIKKGWLYFGNARGYRVYTLATLPKSIENLKDDPYRTLASHLRRRDGFIKNGDTHQEFKWANALRSRVSASMIARNPERAVEIALKFALSAEARDLPGFIGSKKSCEEELERRAQP
jgi:hypothetical protein